MIESLRKQVVNVLNELKQAGIQKITISQKTDIGRPTIDKMFAGAIDNLTIRTIEKLFNAYPEYVNFDVADLERIERLKAQNNTLMSQLDILVRQIERLQDQIDQLKEGKT